MTAELVRADRKTNNGITMSEGYAHLLPIARKITAVVLQRLAEVSQTKVSEMLDVSEATISRMKGEQLEAITALLAALDLKVVPTSAEYYEPAYIQHLRYFAKIGIALDIESPKPANE